MKLISLNIWGGKMFEPLIAFIREQAVDTDIFCFQEVFDTPTNEIVSHDTRINVFRELTLALPDFTAYFAPVLDGFDLAGPSDIPVSCGNAVFLRRRFLITTTSSIFVHKTGGIIPRTIRDEPRAIQNVRLLVNGAPLSIYNFHGLVPEKPIISDDQNGRDPKIDTAERIEQARRIRAILDSDPNPKILSGDFNLRPDTESMNITKGTDLENLIETFGITDTRGPFDPRPVRFADHTLVSKEIRVNDFRVPVVSISDHLPLILTFETTK